MNDDLIIFECSKSDIIRGMWVSRNVVCTLVIQGSNIILHMWCMVYNKFDLSSHNVVWNVSVDRSLVVSYEKRKGRETKNKPVLSTVWFGEKSKYVSEVTQ